jgi:hypothetical protein
MSDESYNTVLRSLATQNLFLMKNVKHVKPRAHRAPSLRDAEALLPLTKVIEVCGHGPNNGNQKSFTCPFCQKRNKAGFFTAPNGTWMFKCQSPSCPTRSKALSVVQFTRQIEGPASNRNAVEACLKQGGVRQEPITVQQPAVLSSDSALAALRFFHDQTMVTDADIKRIWQQRGIAPALRKELGFQELRDSNKH